MTPRVILSLFDFSGEWIAPFANAGHEVITIDVKHDATVHDVRKLSVVLDKLEPCGMIDASREVHASSDQPQCREAARTTPPENP